MQTRHDATIQEFQVDRELPPPLVRAGSPQPPERDLPPIPVCYSFSLCCSNESRFPKGNEPISGKDLERFAKLFEERLDERLDKLEEKWDKRFAVLEKRLTVLEKRLTVLEKRLTVLEKRFTVLENRQERKFSWQTVGVLFGLVCLVVLVVLADQKVIPLSLVAISVLTVAFFGVFGNVLTALKRRFRLDTTLWWSMPDLPQAEEDLSDNKQ